MKDMPTSYYLPDGRLIFAYRYNAEAVDSNWRIGVMQARGRIITWYKEAGDKRYPTEEECRAALHKYAKEHGLKPAY